jgi:hypothetical protein
VPAVSVSPVSSVGEALDRWRAGERVQVLGGEFLVVLAGVPDPRDHPRGGATGWARCWRSRSWRLRPGCVVMPGSPPGHGPRLTMCWRSWVSGIAHRARRPFARCCLGWIPTTSTAGWVPISPPTWSGATQTRSGWCRSRSTARPYAGLCARRPPRRTWCQCSPTAPGWCWASSRSPRRAMKSLACKLF